MCLGCCFFSSENVIWLNLSRPFLSSPPRNRNRRNPGQSKGPRNASGSEVRGQVIRQRQWSASVVSVRSQRSGSGKSEVRVRDRVGRSQMSASEGHCVRSEPRARSESRSESRSDQGSAVRGQRSESEVRDQGSGLRGQDKGQRLGIRLMVRGRVRVVVIVKVKVQVTVILVVRVIVIFIVI